MATAGMALFDTEIGRCGIAWSEHRIIGVQLPEASDALTRARLQRRSPDAHEATPPPAARSAIEGISALLRGEPSDLSDIPLDMERVPAFDRRVFDVARTIRPGATLTYGAVAARISATASPREIGQALGRNPFPLIVPCHRVVAAGGNPGGFSANGGVTTKLRLLAIEGAEVTAQLALFDSPRDVPLNER